MPIRLLHSRDFTFHEFPTRKTPDVPKYAILSHTWGDDEVSFQSFQVVVRDGSIKTDTSLGPGLDKIRNCCKQAAADGYDYTWVDTCCIDKSHLTELTEAINSMFRWYQDSAVCYAYLSDVPEGDDFAADDSAFRRSLWFTRGWTLQELLAPKSVLFFNQSWEYLDTKIQLKRTISEVTGIGEDVLQNGTYDWASVAVKMSWAGRRQTTKIEDQTYSLMGLFGVHMPLIYGEGEMAFQRLQLEIIKMSNDQTIFSWTGNGQPSGMLARSPAEFIPSEDASSIIGNAQNRVFAMTNQGLHIELPLAATPIRNMYVAVLNCFPIRSVAFPRVYQAVFLYRRFDGENDFVRVHNNEIIGYPSPLQWTQPGQPGHLINTDLYIREVKLGLFHMYRRTKFRLKKYPFRSDTQHHQGMTVLGGSDVADHFSSTEQSPGRPPVVTVRLDDDMGSTVLLFKNGDGQHLAVCLTSWGPDTMVGVATDVMHDDMQRLADEFLFGKREQVTKKHGDHTLHVSFPGGRRATVTLGSLERDASTGAYVCEVVVTVGRGDFWFDTAGPGVWPGWWGRYTNLLSAKAAKSDRITHDLQDKLEKQNLQRAQSDAIFRGARLGFS